LYSYDDAPSPLPWTRTHRRTKVQPLLRSASTGAKWFWVIIITVSMAALLSALENSIVTTALPFIVTQLDLGIEYIW